MTDSRRVDMKPFPVFIAACISFAIMYGSAGMAQAQQLEPRAYSPSPVDVNFLGLSYLYSYGGAVLDPSLPVQNLVARVNTVAPFYVRTFGLFGRLANVGATTPLAWGTIHGDVQDVGRTVHREGLADPVFRFAINLYGAPAMTPHEFFKHEPGMILGASLTVIAPFGEYDSSKLINIGTNRWSFKPELGFSQPFGNWIFEFYAGVWLFTANENYFGGTVRRQDPLVAYQTHVIYTFRPRLWAALDYTYYTGGASFINGQPQNDRQANTRGGATLSIPLALQQSLKLTWARGVSTRIGTEFETIGVAWQFLWF